MAAQTELKIHLLNHAGYAYAYECELYINHKTKKAFSVRFVKDHSDEQLRNYIGEPTDGQKWRFYFNDPPSENVKQQLECVLG